MAGKTYEVTVTPKQTVYTGSQAPLSGGAITTDTTESGDQTMKNWTHKVVKKQRGMRGQWFAYPAAMTTDSEQAAKEYAAQFADAQRSAGVVGTRIVVETRGRQFVADYRV